MLLVSPKNFVADEPINLAEKKHFALNDIDNKKLCIQHNELIEYLKKCNVEFEILEAKKDFPEQTFIRDTAFIIDDKVFICKMKEHVRERETELVKEYFQSNEYKKYNIV